MPLLYFFQYIIDRTSHYALWQLDKHLRSIRFIHIFCSATHADVSYIKEHKFENKQNVNRSSLSAASMN